MSGDNFSFSVNSAVVLALDRHIVQFGMFVATVALTSLCGDVIRHAASRDNKSRENTASRVQFAIDVRE